MRPARSLARRELLAAGFGILATRAAVARAAAFRAANDRPRLAVIGCGARWDKRVMDPAGNSGVGKEFPEYANIVTVCDVDAERREPIADVASHHRALTTCHLAGIAARFGRTIHWDRPLSGSSGTNSRPPSWPASRGMGTRPRADRFGGAFCSAIAGAAVRAFPAAGDHGVCLFNVTQCLCLFSLRARAWRGIRYSWVEPRRPRKPTAM